MRLRFPRPSPLRAAHSRKSWVLPNVVLGLLVLALYALLILLRREEASTARSALERDMQAVQQTIRSELESDEAFLQRLAAGIAAGDLGAAPFRNEAAQHVGRNPELAHVVWVDADQVVRWVAPFETTAWNAGERLSTMEQALAYQRAQRTGLPAYSLPVVSQEDGATIELHVPVIHNRAFRGAVVAVYSADDLLRHMAPPWFLEKYRVVLETDDRVLATNSSVVQKTDLTDQVRLDPPGQGLRLRVSAFAAESHVPAGVLVALIAGLVLLVAWSLWGLSAHIQSRLQAEKERDELFNLSLDMLCVLQVDGRVVRASPAFERVLGIAPEALEGKQLLDLVHPDDVAATLALVERLAEGEPTTGFENRCRCADGSYRWLAWSANPVIEEKLLYCVAHDITDRKRSEDAARSESAFRKAMEESVLTGLRAVDMDGRITFVNPAFCEIVGWSAEELVGRVPPFPYWPEEELEALHEVTRKWMRGEAPRSGFEVRIQRKSGERFPARMYISPLVDADGRQTGWMGSLVDISEQKRVEELARHHQERLQQTSRLITMGEMASSIAHELNQPLAAIANYCMGSVNRLRSGAFRQEELLSAMEKASVQAERAGTIIRRMRDFVNKREPSRAPVPVAQVVDDAVAFAEIDARKAGVGIRLEIPSDLPPVSVDRVMIEQVLLNLVKNGVEAMQQAPNGRELTVRARTDDGRAVEIAVEDRGHGFAPEEAEKLFAPFYTTKPQGMGMGLSICRTIVEFHGGRLWAQPNPGGGSVFRFTLPLGG